jgi:S-adenosylmethionine decarboxylase
VPRDPATSRNLTAEVAPVVVVLLPFVSMSNGQADIYGSHLMLRLSEIQRSATLDDPVGVADFLRHLVMGAGMRVLAGPFTSTETGDAEHYGHSGIVLLYESHAAVHTYPHLRALFLDLFSCKPFEIQPLLSLIEEFFGGYTIVESALMDRGHHWSTDAAAELERWAQTR